MAALLALELLNQADPFVRDLMDVTPALRGMAMRYTHEASLAQDLVQDTLVRALRYRDSFVVGSHLKAWVATILTHTFINGYRRQKRERALLEGAAKSDLVVELMGEAEQQAARGPEAQAEQHGLERSVARALERLPEAYREVVVLCDLKGLRYRDAAAKLEVPMGTVMSRLHRARRMLQDALRPEAQARGLVEPAKGQTQAA